MGNCYLMAYNKKFNCVSVLCLPVKPQHDPLQLILGKLQSQHIIKIAHHMETM